MVAELPRPGRDGLVKATGESDESFDGLAAPSGALWARVSRAFPEIAFWVGAFAAAYFWVTVAYDGYINSSWWNFLGSSFSALGDPSSNSSGAAAGLYWFYNDVVIFPTAVMIMVFAAGMAKASRNWIQSIGSAFFIVAGIFLLLVGVFHAGPSTPAGYHDFVSGWFFAQALLSLWLWGFGILLERRWILGGEMLAIGLLAPLIAASVKWPSVASTEAFGIAAIDLWLILMYFAKRPVPKQRT